MQKASLPIRVAGISLLVSTIFMGGCYLTPNFGPPGTIAQQRGQAVVHDPFPNNDIAPPIMGGRPLGFDRPLAEPESYQSSYRNRGGQAPPYSGF